jgi:biopolymer transport protein ExbD
LSVFDTTDFNKKLVEEQDKPFITMYIKKAQQMIDQNEPILAEDNLENALHWCKSMKKHMIKADEKLTEQEPLPEGLELI